MWPSPGYQTISSGQWTLSQDLESRTFPVRGDFTDLLDRAGYHIQLSRGDEARDDNCQTRVFICSREVRQPPPSAASM